MASETSGDFVGACEHPTRIPTTSSASEAKYTGKVLILDLRNHASSCFDRMHTLLPHSAPRLPRRTGHMSSLGLEICRLRLTLPMAPISRLHYSEAQARGPPGVVRPAAENEACSGPSRQGFALGPFRSISPMFHWLTPGQVNGLASATRANGNIPNPRRPVGTTLEERSIGSTCITSPPARADWGPKLKRCVDKGGKGSKLRSLQYQCACRSCRRKTKVAAVRHVPP